MFNDDLKKRIANLESNMLIRVNCEGVGGSSWTYVPLQEVVYALIQQTGLTYVPGTAPHFVVKNTGEQS